MVLPQYTAIDYNISFLDGDTLLTTFNQKYTVNDEVPLPNYTKDGYAFEGWYDNPDFSGSPVTSIAKGSFGDKVYYAKTILSIYTSIPITYNLNGGRLNAIDTAEYQTYYTSFTATRYLKTDTTGGELLLHNSRGGAYWYTIGLKATFIPGIYQVLGKAVGYQNAEADLFITFHDSYKPASMFKTIKSNYDKVTVGSLAVIPNIPSSASTGIALEIYIYTEDNTTANVQVTLRDPQQMLIPIRDGYTFAGWCETTDCSDEPIKNYPGYTSSSGVTSKTYYAKWIANN